MTLCSACTCVLPITGRPDRASHVPTSTMHAPPAVCISGGPCSIHPRSTMKDIVSILLILTLNPVLCFKTKHLEICFLTFLFHIEVNRPYLCLLRVSEKASSCVLLRLLAALVRRSFADNLPREDCWYAATPMLRAGGRHLSKTRFLVSGDNGPQKWDALQKQ